MSVDTTTARIVKRYQQIGWITIGAVVFLIMIGGIVRMTGSGMGCPDWPKCFGYWVPPTDVSQLPDNYQEIYKDHGYATMEFNVFKTWTEYINRLIGVLVGGLILLTAYFSLPFRRINNKISFFSFAALLVVIIQGGVGAYVVRTNLKTGMITIHMVIAMLLLILLIAGVMETYKDKIRRQAEELVIRKEMLWLGLAMMVLTLAQIIMGTQVRESVDIVAASYGEGERANWLNYVTDIYKIHKFFHYVLFLCAIGWLRNIHQFRKQLKWGNRLSLLMISILLIEALMGIGMHNLGMPAIIQPIHLTLATVLFGCEFALFTCLRYARQQEVSLVSATSI